jgi:hypothetical protein
MFKNPNIDNLLALSTMKTWYDMAPMIGGYMKMKAATMYLEDQ